MIEYSTITDIGEREVNEDRLGVFVNEPLLGYGFVLADGLGGHVNGDMASEFVVHCVGAAIKNTDRFDNIFIDECFDIAQELLLEEMQKTKMYSVKTTLVTLLLSENIARWGHIGDSRLYHFRNCRQINRTLDHSISQMMVLSGQIKEKDIRRHPDRNKLLRAMGDELNGPEYEIDEREIHVTKGDTFILCSDGFWEWIDEKNMIKILKMNLSAHDALHEMMAEVKRNAKGKNMDNASAILVNIK